MRLFLALPVSLLTPGWLGSTLDLGCLEIGGDGPSAF